MNKTYQFYFDQLLIRFKRLVKHLFFPFYSNISNEFKPSSAMEWCSDTIFYIMDIIAIPEIYQFLMRLLNWKIRKLNDAELDLAKNMFGDHLLYDRVRINSHARFGIKKIAIAYVSFNTINFENKIRKEIFIHELVHVWQYQQFGSIYIARAIKAQRSKEGYDYGGLPNLYDKMLKGGKLIDFNFEQQADIIEDYYKLLNDQVNVGSMNLNIYRYFANQLDRN